MKKFFLILFVFAAMLSTLVSCDDDSKIPDADLKAKTKGASVKSALKVLSNNQNMERMGFGGASMLNNQFGMTAARTQSGARKLSTARTVEDSTDVDDHTDCEWTTCATETYVENDDGSITWTLDYGEDGCEDYGYWMKGKIIETYIYDENTYSGTIEYINFGDEYFTQNGTSTFSGTWEDNWSEEDSTDYSYSGTYQHSEDMEYTYIDEDEDIEETYSVVASGKQSYDETGFTVEEEDYTYTAENGDTFSGSVSTPLFYSYECETDDNDQWIFVYVSGVENYTYAESDATGTFSIDYGDGECDNIITITENGETYEIDLGEEWEDDWEDEEDGEEDDGNTES